MRRGMLRYADLRDMKALEELEAVCFQEHRYRQEFLEWILKNPRTATLVWGEAGEIAGAVMILLEDGQSRVLSVAVHPSRRRGGVGRRLMEAAEGGSRGRGATAAR